MGTGLKLYGFWQCTCTWRIRIALELKQLDYVYIPLDLVHKGGVQNRKDFCALNPARQVPVLAWEEQGRHHQLTQSLAILHHLEHRCPEPALVPERPELQARCWELAEIVNSGIQPLGNLALLQRLARHHGVDPRQWSQRVIRSGLEVLESHGSRFDSAFLVTDHPTVADLCLVPLLFDARNYGVDLAPFVRLREVEAACSHLPAFRRAHALAQPDAAAAGF